MWRWLEGHGVAGCLFMYVLWPGSRNDVAPFLTYLFAQITAVNG